MKFSQYFSTRSFAELVHMLSEADNVAPEEIKELHTVALDETLLSWRRNAALIQLFLRHSLGKPFKVLLTEYKLAYWTSASTVAATKYGGTFPVYNLVGSNGTIVTVPLQILRAFDTASLTFVLSPQASEAEIRQWFEDRSCPANVAVVDVGGYQSFHDGLPRPFDWVWIHPSHSKELEHLRSERALHLQKTSEFLSSLQR